MGRGDWLSNFGLADCCVALTLHKRESDLSSREDNLPLLLVPLPTNPFLIMSTSAKQFKALGDDVWKNKVEKIASIKKQYQSRSLSNMTRFTECRTLYVNVWITCGATCQGL